MKKTYMTPGIVVVRLQHQSIICLSMKDVDGMGYGGASSNNTQLRYRRSPHPPIQRRLG